MPIHSFEQRLEGKAFPCLQFASRTFPVLTKWHGRFYMDRRKIVPPDIEDLLSPLSLAVWLMDDGAADHAGVTLQTHSFAVEEVERLMAACVGRFGLAASPRRNKGKWILYVRAIDVDHLHAIVDPFLLPGLRYKVVPRRLRTP